VIYLLVEIAFGLLGFLVGRFSVLVLPVIVWTIVGVGWARHWWGNGGEAITLGTIILIGGGIIAVLVGVSTRRALHYLRSK
jgi:hypothetical protein